MRLVVGTCEAIGIAAANDPIPTVRRAAGKQASADAATNGVDEGSPLLSTFNFSVVVGTRPVVTRQVTLPARLNRR